MPSSESSEKTSKSAKSRTPLYASVLLRVGGVDKNRNEKDTDQSLRAYTVGGTCKTGLPYAKITPAESQKQIRAAKNIYFHD